MMAGFIAVLICAGSKEPIKFFGKTLLATKPIDETGNILRCKKSVLDWKSFGDIASFGSRIEGGNPRAIRITSTRESDSRIDHLAVILPACGEELGIFVVAK